MKKLFALAGLLSVGLASSLAQDAPKRPMTFADLMAMKRVSDPQISPSGKWVLFSVTEVSLEKNTEGESSLGGAARRWLGAPSYREHRRELWKVLAQWQVRFLHGRADQGGPVQPHNDRGLG